MNELDRYHDESHVRSIGRVPGGRCCRAWFHRGISRELHEASPAHGVTEKASPENVPKIHAAIARLTPAQREALNLREVNGEPYLNHWYCTLAATIPEA